MASSDVGKLSIMIVWLNDRDINQIRYDILVTHHVNSNLTMKIKMRKVDNASAWPDMDLNYSHHPYPAHEHTIT